jgi:tagatose-1,6-bisphosphate aldolase
MKFICTYCSGPKDHDQSRLPAVQRYISERISQLHQQAQQQECGFMILSGEYGLLLADELIPWYDHLLAADEVAALVAKVTQRLKKQGVSALSYYTADPQQVVAVAPYIELIKQACISAEVVLTVEILAGDPA